MQASRRLHDDERTYDTTGAPPVVPFHKRHAWLHEYDALARQQAELEAGVASALSTSPIHVTSPPLARHSWCRAAMLDDEDLTSLPDSHAALAAWEDVARAGQCEARKRHLANVQLARDTMQNGLLGLTSNGGIGKNGVASFRFDPASAVTRLGALPTGTGSARAAYKDLLTALRGDMRAEGAALAQEAEALDGTAEKTEEKNGASHGLCCNPPHGQDGLRRHAVSWRAESSAAAERYAEFITAAGGPTLGWPEALHDAFLWVAQRVQRETGTTREPLFLTEPPPATPLPLLEAAMAAFYTLVPVPEIELHVKLYLRAAELLRKTREAEGENLPPEELVIAPSQQACCAFVTSDQRQMMGGLAARAAMRQVPWQQHAVGIDGYRLSHACEVIAGAPDPRLQAAIAANVRTVQLMAKQQAETKRRVEAWRAAKAADEAAAAAQKQAEAAAAARARRAAFKHFQQEQRRRNRLGLHPQHRDPEPVGTAGPREGRDQNGEAAAIEPHAAAALAHERNSVRQQRRQILADRQRRDREEAIARRERIQSAKRYEAAHTKAAVAARYLRAVSPCLHSAMDEAVPTDSRAGAGAGTERRYREPTASRTQHVLPDREEMRWQEMGLRGRWLSAATQEQYREGSPSPAE